MNPMMIRLISAVSLAVSVILSADLSAETTTIDSPEAKNTVEIKEKETANVKEALGKSIIVDARSVKQDDDIIRGAIVIPANADDKVITAHLTKKEAEIIVYCGSVKCPASMTLAERLVGLGYTNVAHYAGGIAEWTKDKENNPTQKFSLEQEKTDKKRKSSENITSEANKKQKTE